LVDCNFIKERVFPTRVDYAQLLFDFVPVAGKIGVDKVDNELRRVHVERNGEAAGGEIRLHLRDRTAVCDAALRQ
jgi:hypothetical protein